MVLEHGALGLLPPRQQGHCVAGEQLLDVQLQVVGPLEALDDPVLCGVLDLEAEGAETCGLGMEGGEVELRQAGHGAGEVDALHASFLSAS
ncbi:hypothetical protein D9M70_631480 [compost metagenome]